MSEYQTDFLRAVAVDIRSKEELAGLAESFLEITSFEQRPQFSESSESPPADIQGAFDVAQEVIADLVEPRIDEIHENATRAVDVELEEYRQLQEQRISELEEEIETYQGKIDDLNSTIEAETDQSERKKLLRQRKGLRAELGSLEDERDELAQKRDAGFPEKQREIRDRHALDVTVSPVTLTLAEYEVGDLEISLEQGSRTELIRTQYGSGAGVMDPIKCEDCEEPFASGADVTITDSGLSCSTCLDS